MNLWRFIIPYPVKAIKYHVTEIIELGQLIPIKHKTVFAITDNLHIGFQYLCGEILSENKVDIIIQTVFLAQFYELELLLELTEKHHARRLSRLLRLFD